MIQKVDVLFVLSPRIAMVNFGRQIHGHFCAGKWLTFLTTIFDHDLYSIHFIELA
jgi:hypothetical protein